MKRERAKRIPCIWVCCYFYKMPLEVFTLQQEIAHPFVIAEEVRQQKRVLFANPPATSAGIVPGMSIPTAHSLTPILQVTLRDRQAEQKRLSELALLLYQFTPYVIISTDQLQLTLEISRCLKLFGGQVKLLQKLTQQLSETGYSIRRAIANESASAAQALAYWYAQQAETVIDNRFTIQQLPIRYLPVSIKTIDQLHGIGLQHLSQLMQLPHTQLQRRFGKAFIIQMQQINGTLPTQHRYFTPPEQFQQSYDFITEIEQSSALLFPLKRLLQQLEKFLSMRQKSAIQLILILKQRQLTDTLTFRFTAPIHQANKLLPLIKLRFERLLLTHPVTGITLKCHHFIDQEGGSPITDIFAELLRETDEINRISGANTINNTTINNSNNSNDTVTEVTEKRSSAQNDLIHTLQARLGETRICQLVSHADHRPEKATLLKPLLDIDGVAEAAGTTGRTGRVGTSASAHTLSKEILSKNRPLWLLQQPVSIQLTLFTLLSQPERIESGWWDTLSINRDYYTALDRQQRLCWVFKEQEQWFLHGFFG